VVREIDPAVAMVGVQAMSTIVDRTIAQERMLSSLAIWFGLLALVLGAIGIYGVRSYAVRRRATEIGLRLALGATTRQVFGLVVGQGVRVASVGIALGLGASLALTRFVESLLFRVEPRDPATFVAVALVFAAVAAIASYVPARRAAQVDPSSTLRSE
jgi:ABC-type antimicrobial peptide transport system permease subunit